MIRRSLVPMMGLALLLASSAQVHAFELLDRIFAGGGCGAAAACCEVPVCAPACKARCPKQRCPKVKCCPAPCPAPAPVCEVAAPACPPAACCPKAPRCRPQICLPSINLNLRGLFQCRRACDPCLVEPACGHPGDLAPVEPPVGTAMR